MRGVRKPETMTQAELKQALHYDPATGVFTWRSSTGQRRVRVGAVAGSVKTTGYRDLSVNGRAYLAHRLAWLYMTGRWPTADVDHRNRLRDDNRFHNLREATRAQNGQNRKPRAGSAAGFTGVSRSGGKWCAVIMAGGRQRVIGRFDDLELAKAARLAAEREQFTHAVREAA